MLQSSLGAGIRRLFHLFLDIPKISKLGLPSFCNQKKKKKVTPLPVKCKRTFVALQPLRQRWATCGLVCREGGTGHQGPASLPQAEEPRRCWRRMEQSEGSASCLGSRLLCL